MKRLMVLIGAVALLMAIATMIHELPRYREHKQAHMMRQARAFAAGGDMPNASLCARQVLQADPNNAEACRFMADWSELAHSPTAIQWRQRLLEIEPNLTNRLGLITCALRLEPPPYPSASRALKSLAELGTDPGRYHALSAELCVKLNSWPEAMEHFRAAARAEPGNLLYRLNLASAELLSTNQVVARRARNELEKLATNYNVAPFALRSLVADALRQKNYDRAEELSAKLLQLPQSTFEDRLVQLTVLKEKGVAAPSAEQTNPMENVGPAFRCEELNIALESLKQHCQSNIAEVYSLCEWMGNHDMVDEGLSWLSSLPITEQRSELLGLARANLFQAKGDWFSLSESLSAEHWTELEFLRLALLSRAAWERNERPLAHTRWTSAIRVAGDRLTCLILLRHLAEQCGQNAEDVLWQIAVRLPGEQWPLRELEQRYMTSDNTRGLNRVYAALLETEGGTTVTNRNEFVCTSLLLGKNLARAHAIASELYREHSGDPIIVSTYAYSLHLQGRSAEGLAAMHRLPSQQMETPAIALYYGLLLAHAGEKERALYYFGLAEHASLSPEERKLLERAKQ